MSNLNYVSPVNDKNWQVNNFKMNNGKLTITLHNPNIHTYLERLDEEERFEVETEMMEEIDGCIHNNEQLKILELVNKLKKELNELHQELKYVTLENESLFESFKPLLEQQALIFANI